MTSYNFSERVRRVLARARDEAVQLNHEYVGTEHILLAIAAEREGVARTVFDTLRIDLDEVKNQVFAFVMAGNPARPTGPDLPYTSRAKHVLELSMSEARELNHSYVGTEHLLLGLIREEKGIGAQVLTQAGLTLDGVRKETLRILGMPAIEAAALLAAIKKTNAIINISIDVSYADGSTTHKEFSSAATAMLFLGREHRQQMDN
jgi:ATP-dependent Clp protease ATP-binding subunit ClpC